MPKKPQNNQNFKLNTKNLQKDFVETPTTERKSISFGFNIIFGLSH
jgi:hypothetical protein